MDTGEDPASCADHVQGCEFCQKKLDELTSTRELMGDAVLPKENQVLRAVMEAVKSQGAASSNSLRLPGDVTPFPDPPTEHGPIGTIGRYAVVRRIGEGASGVLYEAFDTQLERAVALKVLRSFSGDAPEAHARLLREAKAIASLRHPSIVTVYEIIDRRDFPPVLVMDLLTGGSLLDLLRKEGRLDANRAATMTMQAAEGIDAAHRVGLIHRDLKPSNLLLDQLSGNQEIVRVADFGLVHDEKSESKLTRTSDLTGTPAYMSPEQVSDPSGVDARSDVYSLGGVLYELLTGRPPFEGSVRRVLWQIDNELPRPPRDLDDRTPLELQNICLKALSKKPANRYQTANEFAADLDRFLSGKRVDARAPSLSQRLQISWKKYPGRWAWAMAGTCALLTIAVFSSWMAVRLRAGRDAEHLRSLRERAGRELAISAVDTMALDIYDNLDDTYVDLDELQIDILHTALDALQRIDSEGGDVGDRHAAALLRLGRSYWRLDELDKSREFLTQAAEEHAHLQPKDALTARSRIMKVEIDAALARLDYDQGSKHAVKNLTKASNAAKTLLEEFSDNESLRSVTVDVTSDLAYAIEESRHPERAASVYEDALKMHEQFGTLTEVPPLRQYERLTLVSEFADFLYAIDYRDQTLQQYTKLYEMTEQILAASDDESYEYTTDVSEFALTAKSGLGLAHTDLQNFEKALGYFDQAIELAQASVTQYPSDASSYDALVSTLVEAASCAQEAGDLKKELLYSQSIVDETDRWCSMNPDDKDRIREAILYRKDLRDVLRAMGDSKAADVGKQIKILQAAVKGKPEP